MVVLRLTQQTFKPVNDYHRLNLMPKSGKEVVHFVTTGPQENRHRKDCESCIQTGKSCKMGCIKQTQGCVHARHILVVAWFWAFANVYILRTNLSVAIVSMVKSNFSASAASECNGAQNNTPPVGWSEDGEFDWDEWAQGQVLSGYFYGYVCTQIFGGWLETRLGGKIVCGTSQLLGGLFTLLTPVAARGGVYALLAVRILVGFVAGITYPTHHGMWGKWAPIYERSRLMSITMAGANFGTVIVLPLSGYLADTYGWDSVFYVTGCIPILWFVFWVIFVYDSPSSHPRIDPEEAKYIESQIETREVKRPFVPWLKMAQCVPLWAIVIGHTCSTWGFYTMLTYLPTYLKQILGFDIKANGFLSALPHLGLMLFVMTGGFVTDYIRKHWVSTLTARRIMTFLGQIPPAIFFVLAGYAGCDRAAGVAMLTLAAAFGGLATPGFKLSHVELAPRFGGILYGITNTFGNIPGFVTPLVVGALTNNNQTREAWQTVFWIGAGIYVFGGLVQTREAWQTVFWIGAGIYVFGGLVVLVFLRTDVQEWAKDPEGEEGPEPGDLASDNTSTRSSTTRL
ncbi:SLC17A5 [Branchiostoma lanceolatum]|uniref:Sialin n=1 Tax=Branchiostoma lanceolatum TaxID=7740 RepID=A0A8K0ENZ5_BRALA|nr:SLC17A5 [Branchiostoma lanceolatum]